METKTYTVNKVKQLVDLNGSSVNFDVNFRVTSKDGKPFQMLVVDQTTLDNNPNLEYKNVTEGQISGNVRSDKNVYQNHFLVLKADNPTMCEVELQKTELPRTVQPPMEIAQPSSQNTETNWRKILIIGCVIALGAYGIYVFFYKEKSSDEEYDGDTKPQFVFFSPKGSPVQSVAPSRTSSMDAPVANPLLERLKKLDLN